MKEIRVPASGRPFKNRVTYCVGTGRMGLALQKEYLDHLDIVQKAIGFKYIRGHGIFCDDVGICREVELDGLKRPFYNFTYLDRIIDSYLERGIRPFLELGFMPALLKSGEQTVFYWKGNVSPPSSYERWAELVKALLAHLGSRYGRDEVATWPVEVWNEPNIPFWAGSMEEYFKLYDVSAAAVKEVDPRIQVGGPAICGVETEKWLRAFFEHCVSHNSPLDFVSRHCYTAGPPDRRGEYAHHLLHDPATMIRELKETRTYMADYPRIAGLPLHITEFNSSYDPTTPAHDTDFHAAYIARILSEAGEYADSYSYWTFSDVFEEADVPKAPFHGGFGLVALHSIKKPTFYAFEFFSTAGSELLYRDEHLLVTRDAGRYAIIGWNWHDMRDGREADTLHYSLSLVSIGKRAIAITRRVGGTEANPLQTWSNLGKPRFPGRTQIDIMREAAEPGRSDQALFEDKGAYAVEVEIPCNRLVMVEILPVEDMTGDYLGFDLKEYCGMK